MRKMTHLLYYWLPPFIWMGMVYFMSSQKSVSITSNPTSEFVTFKTLHMVEYALLFFLFYRAFHSIKNMSEYSFTIYSFAIALSYSLTDELHQLFIPTRQGRMRDIIFDIVGMLIMYGIIRKVRLLRKLL
jgi:VanZ family protein